VDAGLPGSGGVAFSEMVEVVAIRSGFEVRGSRFEVRGSRKSNYGDSELRSE
jgi:hypothetical protein